MEEPNGPGDVHQPNPVRPDQELADQHQRKRHIHRIAADGKQARTDQPVGLIAIDADPKTPPERICPAETVFDCLNRSVARLTIFEKDADYEAFERVLEEARERIGLRLLAYTLMRDCAIAQPTTGALSSGRLPAAK